MQHCSSLYNLNNSGPISKGERGIRGVQGWEKGGLVGMDWVGLEIGGGTKSLSF